MPIWINYLMVRLNRAFVSILNKIGSEVTPMAKLNPIPLKNTADLNDY
jgi:hypothetical protein